MKIGILKETKSPVDNRVALTPLQIRNLRSIYPNLDFFVQPSPTRAFSDREYADLGIPVAENMEECDVLLGIKEANPDTLIPGKHYFFFGHVAKMQLYNKPLLREMVNKRLTFSDWEYLVDNQGGEIGSLRLVCRSCRRLLHSARLGNAHGNGPAARASY